MKTELINKLIEQQEIVTKLKVEAKNEFIENLKKLFVDNPNLKSFSIRINNHEFNDGDSTYFSLYYEDVEVTDTDNNSFERNDWSSSEVDRNASNPLVKAVFELFYDYDIADLHELIFGDHFDRIEISRDNVEDYL